MKCSYCQKRIPNNSIYCPFCGKEVQNKQEGNKINIKPIIIACIGVLAVVAIICLFAYNKQPSVLYSKAEKAYENGNYAKAVKYYSAAGNYEDSQSKLESSTIAYTYQQGKSSFEKKDYSGAIEKLQTVADYEDASDLISQSNYYIAEKMYESGNLLEASQYYKKANYFQDSETKLCAIGKLLVESEDYQNAVDVFSGTRSGSSDEYSNYATGMVAISNKKYKSAADAFKKAGNILDSKAKYSESEYNYGLELLNAKNYSQAKIEFQNSADYQDAKDMIQACDLLFAKSCIEEGNLNSAVNALKEIPSTYTYNNVSASDLSDLLQKNNSWVELCGNWKNTYGFASSESVHRTTNSSMGVWSNTFDDNSYVLEIKCILNADGTVTVKGKGHILVFKNWSSIQIGIDLDKNYDISFEKRINSNEFGNVITIDDNTTIQFSENKIELSYLKKENTKDAFFVYTYKTYVTYGNKTVSY